MLEDRNRALAEFVSATGCSCETASTLLAAHGWCLQLALAEALGVDAQAAAEQERSDRAVAAALEAEERFQVGPAAIREHAQGSEFFDREFAAAFAAADGGAEASMREQEQLILLQEQRRRDDEAAEREQFDLLRAFEQKKRAASPEQRRQAVSGSPAALEVWDLLERARLAQFFDVFLAHGYDEMCVVRQMSNEDMDEVGLKGGHKIKLREALKEAGQVALSVSEVPACSLSGRAAQPSPAEVCSSPHVSDCVDAVRSDESADSLRPSSSQAVPQCQIDSTPREVLSTELSGQKPTTSSQGGDGCARGQQDERGRPGAAGVLALAQGRARSKQRRVIKDGKITFVDE